MKKFLTLLVIIILPLVSFTQVPERTIHFKIDNINDSSEAKEALAILYNIFDEFPDWNNETKVFTIKTSSVVTNDKLKEKMSHHGYILKIQRKLEKIQNNEEI